MIGDRMDQPWDMTTMVDLQVIHMDHHVIMVLLFIHMLEVLVHQVVHKDLRLQVGDIILQMIDIEVIVGKIHLVVDSWKGFSFIYYNIYNIYIIILCYCLIVLWKQKKSKSIYISFWIYIYNGKITSYKLQTFCDRPFQKRPGKEMFGTMTILISYMGYPS
jgi:hypothetical protein